MDWISFTLGFVAFPLAAFLFVLAIRKSTNVEPTAVKNTADLQLVIRHLLEVGTHKETAFLMDSETRLLVRLEKRSRKTKPDTLTIEIRNSNENQKSYPDIRRRLEEQGIEFDEDFTPKLRRPKKISIKYPHGGALVVSAATHVLSTAFGSSEPTGKLDLLVSHRDPFFWSTNPRKPTRA